MSNYQRFPRRVAPCTIKAMDNVSVARQFRVDVPRMAFYADHDRIDSTQTDLLWAYAGKWALTHGCDPMTIRHWCTQTALAPIYVRTVHRLQQSDTPLCSTHLVDDGQQRVVFHRTGKLFLCKPFRIVKSTTSNTTLTVATHVSLHIEVGSQGSQVSWVPQDHTGKEDTPWWGITATALAVAWATLCTF